MSCEGITAFEANMRIALRAQSQCRAAIEAIALLKNPPLFAKQVNTAQQQIVNNGPSRAREVETGHSKLSRAEHELLPDIGASSLTSRNHPPLEAVGEVHRPQDASRQGQGVAKRVQRRAAG